jgi:small-conductance mechanosensitive channel
LRRTRETTALLVALVSAACGSSDLARPAAPASLAALLVEESESLRDLLVGPGVLAFPLVLLVGWAGSRFVLFGMHVLWRLGLDAERRLASYRALIDFAIAVFVVWAMAALLVRVAPVISLIGIGVGLAVLTVALREQVQNVAVGLALVARRRLREGDRVHIQDQIGTVQQVGLTRVELRRNDGAAVVVPTRLLGAMPLVIGHAKHTVPVTVTVAVGAAVPQEALERARRAALMSPYRAIGTQVDLQILPNGSLCVEIQAWSGAAAPDATIQLERALSRELSR